MGDDLVRAERLTSRANSMNAQEPPEERRTAVRNHFPKPSGEVILWVSFEKWIPSQILDIASGGIAVVVETDWWFELEFQVRVEYRQVKQTAVITSANRMGDGRLRVGLKWVDSIANFLDD